MLYQNCRELSCHIFNEICLSGDLTLLIKDKSTNHKPDDLITQWHLIIDEFNDLTNNFESKKNYKNQVEIIYLENLIFFCHFIIELEKIEIINDALQNKIIELKKNHRIKDENKTISLSQNRLNILLHEMNSNEPKSQKNKGFDEVFANIISEGMSFNRYKTTVSEFAHLLNILKKKNSPKK